MAENPNIGTAHQLTEHHDGRPERWVEVLEIVEVFLLAIVAVTTAWSGYQAAKWEGHQAFEYGEASRLHVQADSAGTLGGQQKLLDVSTFNTWIQAEQSGDEKLAALYIRRFSPEYHVAFEAWLKTDPFHDPKAPPGPSYMPEYHNSKTEEAARVSAEAEHVFADGTKARGTADRYVRQTVLLATVLFLIAVAQRFRVRGVRIAADTVAVVLMTYAIGGVLVLPRI
ncbi:MAG: hypothetical protein ACJ76P_13045 [Actinomycetota bacterium]